MRCFVMFVTVVCILFLFKLKWPKNKSFNYILFATLVPELSIHLQKTCTSSSHVEFAYFFSGRLLNNSLQVPFRNGSNMGMWS